MVQQKVNTKPLNYFDYRKMINHLLTKRKLVLVQQTELERIERLHRLPNQHERKYVKRLIQDTEYKSVQ